MTTFRPLFCSLILLTYAAPLWSASKFRKGELNVHTKFTHYSSKSNFSEDGETSLLSEDSSLNLFTTELGLNYSIKNWLKLFGDIDYTYGRSLDPYFERANGALTGLSIGGQFLIEKRWILLIPEISSLISLISVEPSQEFMVLSEGVHSLLIGSHILLKYTFAEPYFYLGFQNRSEKRSQLLQWRVGLRKGIGNLYFGSQLAGFLPLSEDGQKSSFEEKEDLVYRVNAGSLKFFSYNESHIALENWVRWTMNPKWAFQLDYKTSISGKRYAKGYDISLQIIYNVLKKKRKKEVNRPYYRRRMRRRNTILDDYIRTYPISRPKTKKTSKPKGPAPDIKLRKYKKKKRR